MMNSLPLPGAPKRSQFGSADEWVTATHFWLSQNETELLQAGLVAPERTYECADCKDSGFKKDRNRYNSYMRCHHLRPGGWAQDRYGFPERIPLKAWKHLVGHSEASGRAKGWAAKCRKGSWLWIQGAPLETQILGLAVAKELAGRGNRPRYVDAMDSPDNFNDRWKVIASPPETACIARVDAGLSGARLNSLVSLLARLKNTTVVLMGSRPADLRSKRGWEGVLTSIEAMAPTEVRL